MSSVDSRVVAMKFDNAQFQQGVSTTLGSLDKLKSGLKLEGATQGLSNISNMVGKGIGLSNISDSVDKIASRFSAMSLVAITALTNLTNKAVNAGVNLAKSLTIAPITTGMAEYETKLTSIQTILANTEASGAKLPQVSKALDELNTYSDQTIYNFGEMAKNIGTFTAAGVDLDTSVSSIKGIANLAALSGSSSAQASTAMYQLSQAISEGRVSLESWNSVTNAGMGGAIFKKSLAQTAVAMGTLSKDAVKTVDKMGNVTVNGKAFRESIMAKPGQKSWLTKEVLTTALGTFTGDLKDADLAAQGFSKSQIVAIQKQAATAKRAATVVKTGTQLIGVMQEAAQSGWAKSWELIVGDFDEAPKMWTKVNNVIGDMIGASADSRNALIGGWKEMGGRDKLITGIGNAFTALMSVLKPIKDAFRDIFPATTATKLYALTEGFAHFTEKLKIGHATAFKVRRIFQGVFAIFDIGWMVIKKGTDFFMRLFGAVTTGSGDFLTTLAKIGDWFTGLRAAIRDGDGLEKFFTRIGDPIVVVITLLKEFAGHVKDLFSGFTNVDTSGIDKIKKRFEPLGAIGTFIANIWGRVSGFFKNAWTVFQPIAGKFASFFETVGKKVQDSFGNIDYATMLDSINTGLLAGIVLLFQKFVKNGMNINVDAGGGFLDSIKTAFGGLTDTMKAMQANLKANVLLKIAAAIALLTISVVALSMIDSAKLTTALTAMGVMMAQLLGAMYAFDKISGLKGAAKMPFIAGGLILLAIAIDILASAVVKLAKLSWKELAKGLTAVTVLIGALILAVKGMSSKDSTNMIRTGLGLAIMAVGVKILVSAVKDLAAMSWKELAKGLVGVGVILGALTFFTRFSGSDKGALAKGAGIILLAIGIKILAGALKDMGMMSWEVIGKGLATLGGALLLIGGALKLIPASSVLSAAAVLIVATALGMIGEALKSMGGMSWEVIGKGLVVLAGSLMIITGALNGIGMAVPGALALLIVANSLAVLQPILLAFGSMSWDQIGKGLIMLAGALAIIAIALNAVGFAVVGAAAIIIVAGALAILAPILTTFGDMSWEQIGKGLAMLAGVFIVLGLAGLALTPVIGTILLLGIAVGLLGVGIMAAGAGILLFSIGLTAIALAGAAATVAIVGIVSGLIGLIPMVLTQIGMGIVAFAQVIAMSGPAITMAITVVLLALVQAIATITPVVVLTLLTLIMQLLTALANAVPAMISAGMRIITGLLRGIADNIGGIVTLAAEIIVNFINGIADALPDIIHAGVNLIVQFIAGIADGAVDIVNAAADAIVTFVNGLATAIDDHSVELGEAGANLIISMVTGMRSGFGAALRTLAEHSSGLAKTMLNAFADAIDAHSPSREFAKLGKYSVQGLVVGLDKHAKVASDSAANVGHSAINSMRKSLSGMSDLLSGGVDMSPVVRPILDLSGVQKDALGIGDMLTTNPIAVDTTYSSANAAVTSTGYTDTKTALSQSSESAQTRSDIQALTTALAAIPATSTQTSPRPIEFHIAKVEDGDSLFRRARATNKMVTLAEGGDSNQMERIG